MTHHRLGPHAGYIAIHARPRRAVVAGHVQIAIIKADPDDSLLHRRLGDTVDGVVVLGGGGLGDGGAARPAMACGVVLGKIGRNCRPCPSKIAGPEQHLRSEVEHLAIVRRRDNRRVPVKAILQRIDRSAVVAARLR